MAIVRILKGLITKHMPHLNRLISNILLFCSVFNFEVQWCTGTFVLRVSAIMHYRQQKTISRMRQ